jgi:hypothetical protein
MAANAPRPVPDSQPLTVDPANAEFTVPDAKVAVSSLQIYALMAYYLVLLVAAFALLIFLIWQPDRIKIPLLRTVGFIAAGALIGSLLYQIRMLFRFYVADGKFDAKWMGKYISAPWEAVALAVVVLSLLQGGSTALSGEKVTLSESSGFATFGIGALVGFGIRDVVGWLGNLAKTMFHTGPTDSSKP